MIAHLFGNGGAEKGFALVNFPDRGGQKLGGGLFDQVTGGTQRGHFLDVGVVAVRGKDEHLGRRQCRAHLAGGFQPVEQRHGDVHHHHVGLQSPRQGHRLAAGGGFADHFDVALGFNELPQPLADDLVVFRQ